MFFVRTQSDKRTLWSRDMNRIFWEGLTIKAQMNNGEVVTLGIYESPDEAKHVSDNFSFLVDFVRRYIFPEYGYYKKFYAVEAGND